MAPDKAYGILPVVAAGVAGLVIVGLAAAYFARAPEVPKPAPEAVSTIITPTAMAAAEAGDMDAQYAVASAMLADAELSLAYGAKAIGFLQQAAERGHVRAMLRLGLVYRRGVEAPQNYALAAKWIEKSARLGEPQAMLEFGRLNREGLGMPVDLVKAYIWLNRAAAARDLDAPRERGEVARHLTAAELQQAQDESTADHFAPTGASASGATTPTVTTVAAPAPPAAAPTPEGARP